MKRIRNGLIIVFIMILGLTFNVNAQEFRYYLTNANQNYEYVDKNNTKKVDVKRGDSVLVTAIIDNVDNVVNHQISSGKLTIRWDNKMLELQQVNGKFFNDKISDITGLTIASVSKLADRLTINEINSTGFLKPGKNKIVEFKFVVLKDSNPGETKVFQMDGEASLKCFNKDEERTVNCGESLYSELRYNVVKSSVNKLSMIKVDGQNLEYFNENKNDYDITVESTVDKIKLEAIKKDSKSVLAGDIGDKKLDYGLNKLLIHVISESGVKNTYNVNVTREDLRSNDNKLRTLTLSSGELNFNPNTLEYTILVPNEVDKLTITSSLNDEKAKYVTDYKNKEVSLVEGSNKIEIKILSEREEERTYTLNINRALSSNNSLKLLKVDDTKIELRENEFIYYHTVENTIDRVNIFAEATDTRATVNVKDVYDLQVGENEIKIKVKAASGQEASYILNITRKKLLSKDSLLSSLEIKGYDISFKQDETLYNLKINDDDNELEIITKTEDANATVVIEGNKNLENGSIIKINVKAEDGSYTRYFINIEKGSKGISPVLIIIIILLVLLGVCIGLIIYRKKKQENKKFDKLDEIKEEKEIKEENSPQKKVLDTEYDNNEKDA